MESINAIERLIAETERELAILDSKQSSLLEKVKGLKAERDSVQRISFQTTDDFQKAPITNQSSVEEKISLFRELFRGREDVYPRRFESQRTGKSGYQPACRNEWLKGICKKPKIRCNECEYREFLPVTDEIIRNHLLGMDPINKYKADFRVYPNLSNS